MDIRELRIGNYVLFESRMVKVQCVNVGLNNTEEVIILDTDNCRAGCTMEHIKGISLTEDILLRCGFEWTEMYASSGGDSLYFKVLHKPIFKEFQYLQTNSFNYNVQFVADGRCVTTVKYLHQLQNLYFDLCGEELNVEL